MNNFQRLAKFSIALAALVASAAVLPSQLYAQTFFGSIVGTVTDLSGAVIPGANVTITNLGTNEARTETTDATGNYRVVNLVPANYKIAVEAANFEGFLRQPVTVAVDAIVRVDVKLQVGAATETVEVTTQTPLLQTDSGSLESQVQGDTVAQMPLNGRNPLNLISLVPGVVPGSGSMGTTAMNVASVAKSQPSAWSNYNISGGIGEQSAEYVDGVTINVLDNQPALVPTQDAIQEFTVLTSAVSPEFGRFSGGVVEMTTKSGSNNWHGTAYEYVRNKDFNANSFFNNATGTPRPEWNQNQFGIVASGPAIKDRLFGLFAWEHFVTGIGLPQISNTPTAAMQNGIVNGNIVTNLTRTLCPTITYSAVNNTTTIPQSCWDPTAAVMKNLYPPPNANISGDNWYSVPVPSNNQNQYNGRADWVIGQKQDFFARYTWWGLQDSNLGAFGDYNGFKSSNPATHTTTQQVVVGDTYTFNSTTILDVRLGYTRFLFFILPQNGGILDMSQFGGAWGSIASQLTYREYPVPSMSGAYGLPKFNGLDDTSENWYDNSSISASVTKIVGEHTLKAGTEERMSDNIELGICCLDPSGFFTFSRSFIPDEWAAFLLGYPTSGHIHTSTLVGAYDYMQSYYVNDNWMANKKLSLNLGLRWDLPGGLAEHHDKSTVLLPDATDPYTGVTGTVALVRTSLYPGRTTQLVPYKHFQPRVGFAYRLTDSTAIRGGYGLVFIPNQIFGGSREGVNPTSSPVAQGETTLVNTGAAPYHLYSNPFPTGVNQATGRSNPAFMESYLGQAVASPDPTEPFGYDQQWNLTVGQQMKGNWMIEAAYVGSTGTHLPSIGNGTADTYSIDELSSQYYPALNAMLTGFGSSPTSAQITSLVALGQSERPYPAYQDLDNSEVNNESLTYNALTAKIEKRFSSVGDITGAYTWSKAISNTDDLDAGTVGYVQDFNNPHGERSIVSFNVPQRLVVDYILDLPFGRGERYGATTHGVVSAVISGWSVNGISTFQTGMPLGLSTASGNYLTTNWGGGVLRPNYTAGCNKTVSGSPYSRYKSGEWFNTSCFSQPGSIAFGNESRVDGTLRAQGEDNWDFTAAKSMAIKENIKLQFKAEFFNIFNHPQFYYPSTTYGSKFGIVSSQLNDPRLLQLSLRLNY